MDNERLLLREPAKWLAHIAARSHTDGDCRIWHKGFTSGYGQFYAYNKPMRAHRASLTLKLGKPLGNQWALHTCDCRPCVADAHLYAGTRQDNYDDAKRRNPYYRAAAQHDAIERLTRDGKNAKAIAQELGLPLAAIKSWRYRNGRTRPSHKARLMPKAKALRAQGLTYRAIEAELGVSAVTAMRWVSEVARE